MALIPTNVPISPFAPLTILYRGPLASCNYGCRYCPFAKRREGRAAQRSDRLALERFVAWCAAQPTTRPLRIFFTPWGEALVHPRYQRAILQLAALAQVERVAIQTNLAARLDWLAAAEGDLRAKIGIWATFHPSEVTQERFLAQCQRLLALGLRFSIGVVGIREQLEQIEALRAALPSNVYLWVNAYDRRGADYYSAAVLARLSAIDPLFDLNLQRYRSRGHSCRAGASVITVDGDGTMRRCHFIDTPIGNIYQPNWGDALIERPCTRAFCDCHIGYVHLRQHQPPILEGYDDLYELFGDGVLERVPVNSNLANVLG
jgi:hypothetical protein